MRRGTAGARRGGWGAHRFLIREGCGVGGGEDDRRRRERGAAGGGVVCEQLEPALVGRDEPKRAAERGERRRRRRADGARARPERLGKSVAGGGERGRVVPNAAREGHRAGRSDEHHGGRLGGRPPRLHHPVHPGGVPEGERRRVRSAPRENSRARRIARPRNCAVAALTCGEVRGSRAALRR